MKRKFFFFLLGTILFALPAYAAVDSGVRFSSVNGQVEYRPGEDPDAWEFSELSTVLNEKDHVKTGKDSSAVLSFTDMSTFVLKSVSEVVIATRPAKDTQVNLVSGSIWVNVKKMVQDGTMTVKMNQAVAGIKGTNITCKTREDEDRVQVLRGMADVLILATQESVQVNEGEELVIKPGGKKDKQEINTATVQEEWKEELSGMGDSIQMDEIPEMLREIMGSEAEEFGALQEEFKRLMGPDKVPQDEVDDFQKSVERFVGVLMEDQILMTSAEKKVTRAMSDAGSNQNSISILNGYIKMIAEARSSVTKISGEVEKMLRTKFNVGMVAGEGEVAQLMASVDAIQGEIEGILSELAGNPSGLGQDWFLDAQEKVNETLADLGELSNQVGDLLNEYPGDPALVALQKKVGEIQSQINTMIKELSVVEVPDGVLTEIQESEELIAESIEIVGDELSHYNSNVKGAEAAARLRASLSILNNFSRARRLYTNSQRMYNSTMKSSESSKYKTAEIEELEQTFDRITNSYQQLGIVTEQLESRLKDLEDQLGTYLK